MLSCSSPSVLASTIPAPQLPATAPPFPPGEKPSGEATATARHSSNRTTVPPRDAGLHGSGLASPRVRPQPLPGDAPPKSGEIDATPSHHHPSAPPTVVPISPPFSSKPSPVDPAACASYHRSWVASRNTSTSSVTPAPLCTPSTGYHPWFSVVFYLLFVEVEVLADQFNAVLVTK
uniref:Uncharacterized protein n=2 Tax=Triticum urartu TaxID=4572 RepID=A0A8R7VFU7_TRIUA